MAEAAQQGNPRKVWQGTARGFIKTCTKTLPSACSGMRCFFLQSNILLVLVHTDWCGYVSERMRKNPLCSLLSVSLSVFTLWAVLQLQFWIKTPSLKAQKFPAFSKIISVPWSAHGTMQTLPYRAAAVLVSSGLCRWSHPIPCTSLYAQAFSLGYSNSNKPVEMPLSCVVMPRGRSSGTFGADFLRARSLPWHSWHSQAHGMWCLIARSWRGLILVLCEGYEPVCGCPSCFETKQVIVYPQKFPRKISIYIPCHLLARR